MSGSGGVGSSGSGSMYVDATAGAVEHCQTMAAYHADLADAYESMAAACQSKWWHQLTIELLEFTSPAHPKDTLSRTTEDGTHAYLALYDKVVTAVENKLKPLRLAQIAANVAHALASVTQDHTAARAILENLLASKGNNNNNSNSSSNNNNNNGGLGIPATIYVQSTLSLLSLQSLVSPDQLATDTAAQEVIKTVKKTMQDNATLLQKEWSFGNATRQSDPVDQAIVQAVHYQQAMHYYKVVGPPEAFYEQALHFLSYAPVPTTTAGTAAPNPATAADLLSEKPLPGRVHYPSLAVDLCLAALTGEGVYNLGRVVVDQAPMLQLLQDTSHAWLVELLMACAQGEVERFGQLTQQHDKAIQEQPALVHRATAVQEKLALLALVRLVFSKASHERRLSFSEIADCLRVPLDRVEWVVMRALSTGLMQGQMDQVQQTVQVTWVLPRVLTNTQMTELAARFSEWAVQVSKTKDAMQEQIMPTAFALEK